MRTTEWQINLDNATEKKILGFSNYQNGWNYGEGVTPSQETIHLALGLLNVLKMLAFLSTDAFLGNSGEIQVTTYDKEDFLEFTIEPDNLITFVHETSGQVNSYVEGLSINEAVNKLYQYRTNQWASLSELSTKNITTKSSSVLQVFRSNPQVTEESPLLIRSVYCTPLVASAITSSGTTGVFRATPQFIGKSLPTYYRKTVSSSKPQALQETIATITS